MTKKSITFNTQNLYCKPKIVLKIASQQNSTSTAIDGTRQEKGEIQRNVFDRFWYQNKSPR